MNRILVVDDDPYILMSLEFLMKKEGYEVAVARNGKEALTLLKEPGIKLVLLDIMMPDVDGYEICRLIKSDKKLQHIQVVFLSAKSSEADIKKGMSLGAALFVTKPFSTRELLKQVKSLAPVS